MRISLMKMWRFFIFAIMLCVSSIAAGSSKPADVAAQYMMSILSEDYATTISLMHPDALKLAKDGFLSLMDKGSPDEWRKYLGVSDIASIRAMPSDQVVMFFMLALQRKEKMTMGEDNHAFMLRAMKSSKIISLNESINADNAKVSLQISSPAEGGRSVRVREITLNLGMDGNQWKVISQTEGHVSQIPKNSFKADGVAPQP